MRKIYTFSFIAVFLFAGSFVLAGTISGSQTEDQVEGVNPTGSNETPQTSTIIPWTDQCVVEVFGSDTNFVYTGGQRLRGNIFAVDSTVNLVAHKMWLNNPASTNIYFVIYEATAQAGPYTIFNQVQKTIPAGETWFSSGPIDVTLTAGNFYLIAGCWEGSLTYYCDGSLPVECSFGSQIYNVQPNVYPPDQTFSGTLYTNTSYYQTLVTNDGNGPPFIVDITHVSGPPGNLIYDVYVEYLGLVPVDFDGWMDSEYEGGSPTTLILRSFMDYQPGWTINRSGMFFPVPPSWPSGSYEFWLRVGNHPSDVWAEDSFQFDIADIADGSFSGTLPLPDNVPDPFSEIIKGDRTPTVEKSMLSSAYPNPFNPSTTLQFALNKAEQVNVSIYNTQGANVATLVDGYRSAGAHEVTFDASGLTSGVYFVKITTAGQSQIQKLMLIK